MSTTNKFNIKYLQIAILIAIGILGLGYPLFHNMIWQDGIVDIEIDVIDLLSILPYAIWPFSIYEGMKAGFKSKRALNMNVVIVILLVAYTIFSFVRRYHPEIL